MIDDSINYAPSPEMIYETARKIREGEIVVSEGSFRRWQPWRDGTERRPPVLPDVVDARELFGERDDGEE